MKANFFKIGLFLVCCSISTLMSCLKNEDGWEDVDLGLVEEPDEFPPKPEKSKILSSGIEISIRDGAYYLGDDMILTDVQISALNELGMPGIHLNYDDSANGLRSIAPRTGLWWYPDSVMSRSHAQNPYIHNLWSMVRIVYASDLPENMKSAARMAMRFWQDRTNVRFYNATGEPTEDAASGIKYPYVYFCKGDVTSSYVGQIGGKQELYISENNCSYQAIAHEIGHALGMYHEHMRNDRDDFIIINMENIIESARKNFQKITSDYYYVEDLDFGSIMMYPSFTGFERTFGIPSMTKLDGSIFEAQRTNLSKNDMRYANKFFLPFVARIDNYMELESVVYDDNNNRLSEEARLRLQASLNNGVSVPPEWGRIPNNL